MPRHSICKKVCQMPKCSYYKAVDSVDSKATVISVEEYEAIRLMDFRGYTQREAAKKMGISRASFQLLYEKARKTIGYALFNATDLIVEGGNYYLCDGKEEYCDCGGCKKHSCENKI